MERFVFISLIVVLQLLSPPQGLSNDFNKKLSDFGMSFTLPEGFEPVTPKGNANISCDFAIRHTKKRVEVRYALLPVTQSQEPLEATFAVIAANISGKDKGNFLPGGLQAPTRFAPQDVRAEFGADSGLAALIDLASESSGDYKKCNVTALRKNGAGQALIFRLYDNDHIFLDIDFITFYSLKFSDAGR